MKFNLIDNRENLDSISIQLIQNNIKCPLSFIQ